MKNQYFGDINDYRKYGIMLALQSEGINKLLVAWMLAPDDRGSDGSLRSCLHLPKQWRRFDPELFDNLVDSLKSGPTGVRLIERSKILPCTSFFTAEVQINKKTANYGERRS